MVYFPWFIFPGLFSLVYFPWFIFPGLFSLVYFPWLIFPGLFSLVYFLWFIFSGLLSLVYFVVLMSNPISLLCLIMISTSGISDIEYVYTVMFMLIIHQSIGGGGDIHNKTTRGSPMGFVVLNILY